VDIRIADILGIQRSRGFIVSLHDDVCQPLKPASREESELVDAFHSNFSSLSCPLRCLNAVYLRSQSRDSVLLEVRERLVADLSVVAG
jgi:hypothetical protein